jgi:alpha-tubulin suppressor-like RCC1 family protein
MSDRFPGGVVSKTPPEVVGPTDGEGGTTSGVWSLDEVLEYQKAGAWPKRVAPKELYTWGANSNGQLGDGTTTNKSSPIQIGALTTWKSLSLNSSISRSPAGIFTTGELYLWGNNSGGQLGLGDTTNRSSPVQVGSLTNWLQIAGDLFSSHAVKTDGTLWSWGDNGNGQLGNGTTTSTSSPIQVGAQTYWSLVSACAETAVALTNTGALYAWGANSAGQLGQNDTTKRSSPVQVGALTNWAWVSVGGISQASSCVSVKTDGTLWAWGSNRFGALGLGDTTYRSSPVQVGTLTDWAKVSSSSALFSLAVKTNGTLWAWGYNISGRLGDGTTTNKSSPVQIGALTNWSSVSAGSRGGLSIKTDGTLWGWGSGYGGFIGDGTTTDRSSPVQIGAETTWSVVSAMNVFSAATVKAT